MFFSLEKVSKDTYLKVFENILSNTDLKPDNSDILTSEVKLSLNNEKFDLNLGMSAYENLQKNSSFYLKNNIKIPALFCSFCGCSFLEN